MKQVKVGVVGFGTVGAGVVRLLLDHAPLIEKRLGFPLTLAGVADLDVTTDRGVNVPVGLPGTHPHNRHASKNNSYTRLICIILLPSCKPSSAITSSSTASTLSSL